MSQWVQVKSKTEGVCPNDQTPLEILGRQAICFTCKARFKREKVKHVPRRSTERDVTQDEMDLFEKHAWKESPRDYFVYYFMARHGLRIGTIISNHRRNCNVPGFQIEDVKTDRIYYRTKMGTEHWQYVEPEVIAKFREVCIGKRTSGTVYEEYVNLVDPVGNFLHKTKRFAKAVGIVDWQYIRNHAFRHGFGNHLSELTNGNAFIVRDGLDHARNNMTSVSRYVARSSPEKLRDILQQKQIVGS